MDVGDWPDDCLVGTKLPMLLVLSPMLGLDVREGMGWVNGELYADCIPDFLASSAPIICDCLTFY